MPSFTTAERTYAQRIAALSYGNPFLPARIEMERAALGRAFDANLSDWNTRAGAETDHPNLLALIEKSRNLLVEHQRRLNTTDELPLADAALYEDLALFVLYHDHRAPLDALTENAAARRNQTPATIYAHLQREANILFGQHPAFRPLLAQLPHLFAGFFQLRRAFSNIFRFIVGTGPTTVALRASVWESIFTHDMRRYRQLLFSRMGDFSTLITGPSGTGKELVAQAIGRSRYIPFDATTGRFAEEPSGSFFPISLAAMSPTLIEAELFGHARGAFTGAIAERAGWLEACPPSGTVFLDEIGELDAAIQVKLLRVLQAREFSRLGETKLRQFTGKIVAATNRNLAEELRGGRFREDLYYRLCSDVVTVPSLRQRLDADPSELAELIGHLSRRILGDDSPDVAAEVAAVIATDLGGDYAWPGNVRELEQCVRNVIVRRKYNRLTAASDTPAANEAEQLMQAVQSGALTADALLRMYCRRVYQQTGSYEAAARRLALDRRTVKAYVASGESDQEQI